MFTELKVPGPAKVMQPRIVLNQQTLDAIENLMGYAGRLTPPCEVQFYLCIDRTQVGSLINYELSTITVPKQVVRPAFVETTADQQQEYDTDLRRRFGCNRIGRIEGGFKVEAYEDFYSPHMQDLTIEDVSIDDFGKRFQNYQNFKRRSAVWCHSHVNMPTNPSSTDNTQWGEWKKAFGVDQEFVEGTTAPAVAMLIFNLAGHIFNRVYDVLLDMEFENVPVVIQADNVLEKSFIQSYVTQYVAPPKAANGTNTGKTHVTSPVVKSNTQSGLPDKSMSESMKTHKSRIQSFLTSSLSAMTGNYESLAPLIPTFKANAEAFLRGYLPLAQEYEKTSKKSFISESHLLATLFSTEDTKCFYQDWLLWMESISAHGNEDKSKTNLPWTSMFANAFDHASPNEIKWRPGGTPIISKDAPLARITELIVNDARGIYPYIAYAFAVHLTGKLYSKAPQAEYYVLDKFIHAFFDVAKNTLRPEIEDILHWKGTDRLHFETYEITRIYAYPTIPVPFEILLFAFGLMNRLTYYPEECDSDFPKAIKSEYALMSNDLPPCIFRSRTAFSKKEIDNSPLATTTELAIVRRRDENEDDVEYNIAEFISSDTQSYEANAKRHPRFTDDLGYLGDEELS